MTNGPSKSGGAAASRRLMNRAPVVAALLLAAMPAHAADKIVPQCWDEQLPDGSVGHNCAVPGAGPPHLPVSPPVIDAPIPTPPLASVPPPRPSALALGPLHPLWMEPPWLPRRIGIVNYTVRCWSRDEYTPRECGWHAEQCEELRVVRHGGICTPAWRFPPN
jgi:hypothetical protein